MALLEKRLYPLAELSARKSMAHYEIERLSRLMPPSPSIALDRFEYARKVLEENRKLLKRNIDALGELIEMLRNHQLIDESDGTYSAQSFAHLADQC